MSLHLQGSEKSLFKHFFENLFEISEDFLQPSGNLHLIGPKQFRNFLFGTLFDNIQSEDLFILISQEGKSHSKARIFQLLNPPVARMTAIDVVAGSNLGTGTQGEKGGHVEEFIFFTHRHI